MSKMTLALLWTAFIIVASGLSKGTVEMLDLTTLFQLDKLMHAGVYMIYVVLWYRALQDKGHDRSWRWAFISSVVLGIVMEILQYTIFTGRSFEFLDIIANISGSVVGLIIIFKLLKE